MIIAKNPSSRYIIIVICGEQLCIWIINNTVAFGPPPFWWIITFLLLLSASLSIGIRITRDEWIEYGLRSRSWILYLLYADTIAILALGLRSIAHLTSVWDIVNIGGPIGITSLLIGNIIAVYGILATWRTNTSERKGVRIRVVWAVLLGIVQLGSGFVPASLWISPRSVGVPG